MHMTQTILQKRFLQTDYSTCLVVEKPLILLCVYVYRHLTAVHAERVCWIQEINPRHSNV